MPTDLPLKDVDVFVGPARGSQYEKDAIVPAVFVYRTPADAEVRPDKRRGLVPEEFFADADEYRQYQKAIKDGLIHEYKKSYPVTATTDEAVLWATIAGEHSGLKSEAEDANLQYQESDQARFINRLEAS